MFKWPEKHHLVFYTALFLILFISLSPALRGKFIIDDTTYIKNNVRITDSSSPIPLWTSFSGADYWPVSYTVFWAYWKVFQEWSLPYHLTNLLLHFINVLLFGVLLARYRVKSRWLAVTLFCLHPVGVESIAWIFQLKTLLATTLSLLSWMFYLDYLEESQIKRYRLSIAFFLLAMLSKASVAFLPFVFLLHHLWKKDRLNARLLLRLLPFGLVSFIFVAITYFQLSVNKAQANIMIWDAGLLERTLTAARNFWFYLGKLVWPYPLVFVYERVTLSPEHWPSYLPLVCFAGSAVFLLRKQRTSRGARGALFCFLFYFINLIPILGWVDIGYMRFSLVADHWQYFPSLAGVVLLSGGAYFLIEKLQNLLPSRERLFHALVPAPLLYWIGLFAILSFNQAKMYRNRETLWKTTKKHNSTTALTRYNLGTYYQQQGRMEKALREFRAAIRLQPTHHQAYSNIGWIYLKQKKYDKSESAYKKG